MVDEIEMDKIIDDDANTKIRFCKKCGKAKNETLSNTIDICKC